MTSMQKRRQRQQRREHQRRERRGAITLLTAIMFLSLTGIAALAIDFGRMWTVKNELQTAADAGAMAGAFQMTPMRVAANAVDSAIAFAKRNKAMADTVTVDSTILGTWNNTSRTFTAGATPANAIQVVVSRSVRGFFMGTFGVTPGRFKARAIGWGAAPVGADACTKPWAIPYEVLMLAVNQYRGIPSTNANLNRAWTQADYTALSQMSAGQRTFTLKIGQNNNANNGQITQTAADSTNMPGNFQAVRLGKYWDFATSSYASPAPQTGGNTYRDNISGVNGCYSIAPGDSLQTETGNKKGPTDQGLRAFCPQMSGNNCLDANGNPTVTVASSFFRCGSGCSGQSVVSIQLIGSFILSSYNQGSGDLTGIFNPIARAGPVGSSGASSTLVKAILVQ